MGAPRKAETRSRTVDVRLTPAEYEAMAAELERTGATASSFMRVAMRRYLDDISARRDRPLR